MVSSVQICPKKLSKQSFVVSKYKRRMKKKKKRKKERKKPNLQTCFSLNSQSGRVNIKCIGYIKTSNVLRSHYFEHTIIEINKKYVTHSMGEEIVI